MIAKLTGRVDSLGRDNAVIDVNGVGYLVRGSARTLGRLGVGDSTSLAVETMLRQDALELFGFIDAAERDWFRLLLTVQGVGARIALAILSALPLDQIATAIAQGDRAMLARADGVGPKLAQRIANELKDKVGTLGESAEAAPVAAGGVEADAVSALINLGYRRAEAERAIGRATAKNPGAGLERLIALALRELAPR